MGKSGQDNDTGRYNGAGTAAEAYTKGKEGIGLIFGGQRHALGKMGSSVI